MVACCVVLCVTDTTSPAAPTVSVPAFINVDSASAVVVSLSDAEAGASGSVSLEDANGALVTALVSIPAGSSSASVTLNASGLSDGPVRASASLQDAAGNVSPVGEANSTKGGWPEL